MVLPILRSYSPHGRPLELTQCFFSVPSNPPAIEVTLP